MLVESTSGNVLWDCVSLIDDATIDAVQKLGGIAIIALPALLREHGRMEPGFRKRAVSTPVGNGCG